MFDMKNMEEVIQAISIGVIFVDFLLNTCRVLKAIELLKECLIILDNKAVTKEEVFQTFTEIIYFKLFEAYCLVNDYTRALQYGRKLLSMFHKRGEKVLESRLSLQLAKLYEEQCKHLEAKGLCEKALAISTEIGDCKGQASAYGNLGVVFRSLGEYVKAKDYHERAIKITKATGDRREEASCYVNLGNVFHSLGEHHKAKEHMEKALLIMKEIGDKRGEAFCYGNLGAVFLILGEYLSSVTHLQKALAMRIKIGNDRNGEARDYGNLGTVFYYLAEYGKAKIYLEKAIAIKKEIGDKRGEAADYGTLGNVFLSLSEYVKGKVYHEKALAISQEFGDRYGEATAYGNLGTAFVNLGEYVKAEECLENALAIKKEIGDRDGEGRSYGSLGNVFLSLGKYATAKDYFEKALAISKETGYRNGEAICYGNLGKVFFFIGDYVKAEEHYEKALEIRKEIGSLDGEAAYYGNLGGVFICLGEYVKAKDYLEKALAMSKEIGNVEQQFVSLYKLAQLKFYQGKTQEAFSYLHSSICKCEELRGFLGDNDQFKINFSDLRGFPYWKLSEMFCDSGNPYEALYVAELGRARALADLMSAQYSVKNQVSVNPQSRAGIEQIMKKESSCTCLYISYSSQVLLLWVLNKSGVMHFRQMKINDDTASRGLQQVRNLNDFFAKSFRRFAILPEERCEDRSLHDDVKATSKSTQKGSPASFRIVEEEEENKNQEPDISLCYKMIIAPVADLLEEPEIIIVPDRSLYKVPFAALPDKRGKYLAETFRIRIVPSFTTLKLIQDSPADYHSQTGALIVGDPDVGLVRYKGKKKNISRLPCAGNEAAMIGRLLGVQPLLGEQATKQAVLDRINSVSLVHFAAHGDAERGEIALCPPRPITKIPVEEEYLLTMSDISRVQLRAKLVVLSCCHSGQGETKVEGVVGIARAFLGSGARSVLVALWALEDSATEQLMNNFYGHLVLGESASESLHEAMKWMRANGYNHVRQWAPFMLIGDNVTFDFRK
ncbi:uncharacterized protein LOC144654306 [Oculina patagonica]